MSEDTAVQSEVVQLDPTKLVGALTVGEFRQLMLEAIPSRRGPKAPQGPRAHPATAPEGLTMSVRDVVEATGIGDMTIKRLCREGGFGEGAAVKVGGQWCIQPEAVTAYAAGKADRIAAKVAAKAAKAATKAGEAVSVTDIEHTDLDLSELDLDGADVEGDENEGVETDEGEGEVEIDADAE